MQPKENNDIKTDLKHDNMEFSAATDGDDKLDADDFNREEDGISSEELDALEDNEDAMAAALNAVEADRMVDSDNLTEESEEDDYYDNDDETEKTEERL